MEKAFEGSRRFYEEDVRGMIRELFPKYEKRIAVGLVGEGSDCFGYDDVLSKDHDYGTGVCLWITEEDFAKIGSPLSIAYNELLDKKGIVLSERLRENGLSRGMDPYLERYVNEVLDGRRTIH